MSRAFSQSGENNSLDKVEDEFAALDIYFKRNLTEGEKAQNYTNNIIPFTTDFSSKNSTSSEKNDTQSPVPAASSNIDPIKQGNKNKINETRNPRQELDSPEERASQEQDSSEEEGGGNMLTGLLSAFLSGLSRADGSIDIEAIIGLLGSLSSQNPDGSYDFNSLSELLRSFFGGGADGGGSDIGAFIGGLAGASIKGVASPPGPKGAGILAGKVVTGVLPALSAPPKDDANGPWKQEPQLDSGSFLTGFLKTVLGSGGNGMNQGGKGSTYNVFKLVFSTITGLFTSSSSLSTKSDWN
ncbi:hypothetical protein HUJ04_010668 [Dendroctonus ponderosae]|nr:hypothetical protein HUJ04_010668 [Dendroctonus ponderosae]